MANEKYVGTNVSAVKYRRCHNVVIGNEIGDVPFITFSEEDVIKVDSQNVIRNGQSSITEQLTAGNMNESFQIVDPVTLLPTGATMTYAQFNVAVRSLYAYISGKRDAAL